MGVRAVAVLSLRAADVTLTLAGVGACRLLSEGGDRSLTARIDEEFKIERGGGGKSVLGAHPRLLVLLRRGLPSAVQRDGSRTQYPR